MNDIGVVFSAEFVRRIRSRAYLAATVIGAISLVLISLLPKVLTASLGASSHRVVLVGEPRLTAAAKGLLERDYAIDTPVAHLEGAPTVAFLDAHGSAAAAAVLTRATDGSLDVHVYARDPSLYRTAFARDLAPLQLALRAGVPLDETEQRSTVAVEVRAVGNRFADAGSAEAAKALAYLFVFLLYIGILLNAQAIMASVAEEKTSRIAELLVATIDPARLLAAKVLAAAATGVIQLGVWIAAGGIAGRAIVGIVADRAPQADAPAMLVPFTLPPGELLALVAFFLIGFTQYAVLYAGAASLINRTEDLGSVAGPLVIPVVFGFLLAQIGLQSPNAIQVVICSQIPLLAPFVMFTRLAVVNVPAWQIALSLTINVVAAILLALLAGRVYRVGLLLYGRPPSLKQVLATLRG